jgi:thiol-disulfide isomerase/thioredoxin
MTILTRRLMLSLAGTVAATAWIGKSLAEQRLDDVSEMTRIAPPEPAPPIVYEDQEGRRHGLAELRGHGVVLNLWATWCPPCVAEMPALDQLAARLKETGHIVLPIAFDRGGAAAVRAFYDSHGIENLPIALDPEGRTLGLLHVDGIPTTFLIDRNGLIAAKLEGAINWAAADALPTLRPILEKGTS